MTKKTLAIFITTLLVHFALIIPIRAQEDATQSSDSIREKVRQKIEEVKNKPKAYIGTVTDKTEAGMQMEGKEGEIQQLSINEGASFIKTNKSSKTITLNDIAIGDFIIAMGYSNVNDILETKRVIQTDPIEPPNRQIIYGSVKEIESKTLTVTASDEEFGAVFPKRWKGPEIVEFEKNDEIVLVVIKDEGKLTIRTIEIIKSSNSSPTPEEEEK